jgi:gliding motility-associated-like protein
MAPGYVTYLWQDGSAGSTYTVTSSGSYSVVVTDSFGCISSDEINITMNETPAAGFSATPPAITAADTEVTFSAINPDEGLAYAWSFESGTPQASDALNPVVNFTSIPGNYEVMLVVSNTIGCADTAYYTIYIESDGQISLPNIFTPNGDGDNDRFIPFQDYPGNWKLTIFNRWGTAIFETTNLLQGWTGEGHTAGTYYWILNPSAGQSGTRKSGYVMMVKEEN